MKKIITIKCISIICVFAFALSCVFSDSNFGISASSTSISVWDGKKAISFAGGTGTKQDPYLIANGGQLYYMLSLGNSFTSGKYYKITKDIYLNDVTVSYWKSKSPNVWINSASFGGNLDGDNHIIYGIYYKNYDSDYAGLIPKLGAVAGYTAKVENIGIEKSYICGKRAGSIVGSVTNKYITIKNCYADDSVEVYGGINCAGLVGEIKADYFTLTNCYFTGKLTGGNVNAPKAGLIGNVNGVEKNYTVTLSNCYVCTSDNDYTIVPISNAGNIRCINLYGTREQTFLNDNNTVSYTLLGDFFVTNKEEMIGEKAKISMPKLDYGSVWVTQNESTPILRCFTGDTTEINGDIGALWSGNIATQYADGKGTKAEPYKIATAEQLALLITTSIYEPLVTEGKHYVLTEDIFLNDTSTANWYENEDVKHWFYDLSYRSIGFLGHFNGNGHTINGICYLKTPEWRSLGLFGSLGGSALVENVAIANMYSEEAHWVGAISGFISQLASSENPVTIKQCVSDDSNKLNGSFVGGILSHACNSVIISDCISQVEIPRMHSKGTIIGMVDSKYDVIIKNCLSLDIGRTDMLWYSENADKKIPIMQNLYSTYSCIGAETILISDINGEKAKDTLKGFDFVSIWDTVDGGTPIIRGFTDTRYSLPKKKVTILFETFGGTQIDSITGYAGDRIKWPDVTKIYRNKDVFKDWYVDKDLLRKYPYETFPEYDMVLYAGWEEAVWDGKVSTHFDGGSGTEMDPYLISTGGQLYRMLELGHKNNQGYFKITKDIYLNDVSNVDWITQNPNIWYELDVTETHGAFSGHLDGDGHVIYGIYYPDNENRLYAGLIPKVVVKENKTVEIKNIGIEDSYISAKNASGIVSFLKGDNKNSGNTEISKCYVDDSVIINGTQHQGGLVAFLWHPDTSISNCYSLAKFKNILDTTKDWQGGIVGFASGPTVEEFEKCVLKNCYTITPDKIPATTVSWNYTCSNFINIYGNSNNGFVKNNFPAIKILSTDKMKGNNALKYMSNLNFESVWEIKGQYEYPTLRIFDRNGIYDANKDGNINSIDVVYYKKCLSYIYEYEVSDLDFNCDTLVNGKDLIVLRKKLLGDDVNLVEQIPAKALTQTIEGTMGTYNLVWNDEFDKTGIDYNKWCYGSENSDKYDNMLLLTEQDDPSIITAKDGLLKMYARRYVSKSNPLIEYAAPRAFGTRETMNFKYGYIEMRAMVPMKQGSFSAFWSVGKPALVQKQSNHYYIEMDFFECFSSCFQLCANFHKWYDDGGHSNFDLNLSNKLGTSIGTSKYRYFNFQNYETLPLEYHTYAVEWTKECIKTFVDGECYTSIDITMPYDAEWEYSNTTNTSIPLNAVWRNDMSGYHDYIYLLLQNLIYVSDSSLTNNVNEDSPFPYGFLVDYVRLYQNPDNQDNGLIFKNELGQVVDYYSK